MARGLKFQIYEVDELYYLCSEKGLISLPRSSPAFLLSHIQKAWFVSRRSILSWVSDHILGQHQLCIRIPELSHYILSFWIFGYFDFGFVGRSSVLNMVTPWHAHVCPSCDQARVCVATWLRGYKTFVMLNSAEHEIKTAHKNCKNNNTKSMEISGLNHQNQSLILLINVKMAKIAGILTLLSRLNFMLS